MEVRRFAKQDIEKNLARFKSLRPRQSNYEADKGIPVEAYEMLAAKRIFQLMAPEGAGGANAYPAVKGDSGLSVSICECPPGNGPALHAHQMTTETFLCLDGTFEIILGEDRDSETPRLVLNKYDMIRVPPNVFRAFRNVGSEQGYLLVMIQGDGTSLNDVAFSPEVRHAVASRFGDNVVDRFIEHTGIRFDAILEEPRK
jgi:oxalate decarboxylase/phosphoglucose isomerase-like protein (cupin superfamily)